MVTRTNNNSSITPLFRLRESLSSSEPLIVNKHLSIKLDQYEENKRFLTIKNENDLQSEASEYIIGPWNILHDSDIHGRKSDLQSNIQYLFY